MPRVSFQEENKNSNNIDWTKLKLTLVKDECVRVVCVEDPETEYVHQLRAPKIVNGVPQMAEFKRKDGSVYEDYEMDFIGRPLCLGDWATLEDSGSDPENCPICAMAKNTDFVDKPQRRYAMNVLRYSTKPGSFAITTPFGVSVVVWTFTDKIFNKLTDFQTEWGPLTEHDLLLGPCNNPTYQQYDIAIAKVAEYAADDARKQQAALTFKENQIADLSVFCGRRQERRWIEDDLTTVTNRWKLARGGQVAATDHAASAASLTAGFSDLLDSVTPTKAPAPAEVSVAEEVPVVVETPAPVPAATAPAQTVAAGSTKQSFADLLKDLEK